MRSYVSVGIGFLMLWLLIGVWRLRKKGVSVGPGAAGMMHEILSNERRAAMEIILEERAAAHEPEDAEGDLQRLRRPVGKPRS